LRLGNDLPITPSSGNHDGDLGLLAGLLDLLINRKLLFL